MRGLFIHFATRPVTTFIRVTSRKHDDDTCFPSFVIRRAPKKRNFNCQIRARIDKFVVILTRADIYGVNINAPCNSAENLSKIAYANSASIVLIKVIILMGLPVPR